ncbi:unnamed protein product [Withania somnifera]
MSCSEKSKEREEEENPVGSIQKYVEGVSRNGSIVHSTLLSIDERVLVDPKQLFIGMKIGEGAHGKVYEGRYGEQIVAIKVVNGGNTSEERSSLESRFVREVVMMSRVKHENLVKVSITFFFFQVPKNPNTILIIFSKCCF